MTGHENDNRPTHFDVYSGIGGFSYAFEAEGFRTVAFSEIDEDKCIVLREYWPHVPNLGPVEAIRGTPGQIDVLTGGVPCQPASALGQMRGTADPRWQWPNAIRLVREFRPRFAVFENPPSILVLEDGRAWNGIVSELVACGYDLWWDVFPAAAFGAGHLRERILLVCSDAARIGKRNTDLQAHSITDGKQARAVLASVCADDAGDANRQGFQGHAGNGADGRGRPREGRSVAPADLRDRVRDFGNGLPWWFEANTGVPVLAHGLPARLVEAASRCAGDSVVPQVIQPIARAIRRCL